MRINSIEGRTFNLYQNHYKIKVEMSLLTFFVENLIFKVDQQASFPLTFLSPHGWKTLAGATMEEPEC